MKTEEIKINYDRFERKIFATRVVSGEKFGVCQSVPHTSSFVCPRCRQNDYSKIKEIKIDGGPEIKPICYGYGFADTRFGRAYAEIGEYKKSRDYPVSVKFLCENCRNEFTNPDLLKSQMEAEKEDEKKAKDIYAEVYYKLQTLTPSKGE